MYRAFGDWLPFIFFTIGFLLLLIPVWFVSAVATVSSSGIRLSRFFGAYRRELEWNEIERIKPAILGVGMKLFTTDGRMMTISSQMMGYPVLVEILQELRPDLFDMNGLKVFQKGLLAKYGLFFILIPATPMALGAVFVPPFLPGIFVAVLIFYLWSYALNGVYKVKVEENRLSIRSFRRKHELTAQQIKDIRMVTRYNRRGVATNFIQIEMPDQNGILFTGFPEGNEMMFGFLKNWWGANQST
jgi:hypothetical protein